MSLAVGLTIKRSVHPNLNDDQVDNIIKILAEVDNNAGLKVANGSI